MFYQQGSYRPGKAIMNDYIRQMQLRKGYEIKKNAGIAGMKKKSTDLLLLDKLFCDKLVVVRIYLDQVDTRSKIVYINCFVQYLVF